MMLMEGLTSEYKMFFDEFESEEMEVDETLQTSNYFQDELKIIESDIFDDSEEYGHFWGKRIEDFEFHLELESEKKEADVLLRDSWWPMEFSKEEKSGGLLEIKTPREPNFAKLPVSEVHPPPRATTTKIPDLKPAKIQDLPPTQMLELTSSSKTRESKPKNPKPVKNTPSKMTGQRLFPRADKKEEKSKPGFVRIIIKNQEISIPDPDVPMFEMPRERKFKQIDGNVYVVSPNESKISSELHVVKSYERKRTVPAQKKETVKQKRVQMNNAERLRRSEITVKLQELKDKIPENYLAQENVGNGASKYQILSATTKFCKALQNKYAELDVTLEREKWRKRQLANHISKLNKQKYHA
eukprot:TRINITY_DN12609_c0_g1_i1.p1 TRINITY_DN12609_c0_g1~~TRINITY_DN12609_c0_g1_i1.p1  ORF type:complete len:356 (-),score=82.79 TRINITY_DN12609_c0_g1_i1:177-1244(-)